VSADPPAPAGSVPRGPRRRLRLAGLVVALLLVLDWTRAPSQQSRPDSARRVPGTRSGFRLAARGGVRFASPSRSRYGAAVLARDGFVAGNLRTFGRLLRCGPWTGAGTVDPP
jgi:hypothetical protein